MRLRLIALVAAGTLCLAQPAASARFSYDDLSFALGATAYRIPHLEIEGAALSAADLARFFAQGPEGLAHVSAARIIIPELFGETTLGAAKQHIIYKDVTLENVAGGRIGALRAASMEQAADRPGAGRMAARYQGLALAGLDLKQLAHVAGAARAAQEAPGLVGESGTVESATFSYPDAKFAVSLGRASVSGLKARALAEPWPRLLERLAQAAPSGGPEGAAQGAALLAGLADALAAVEIGNVEIADLSARGLDPAKPYAIGCERLAVTKLAGAVADEAVAENIALASADGGVLALRRLALSGFDMQPLFGARWPRIKRLAAQGLSADLPDANAAGRVKFGLAAATADFSDYVDGLPSKATAQVEHFGVALAERGETPATALFLALGYRDLDLSAGFDGAWREPERRASIERLSFYAQDMGAVTLSATVEGVSPGLFSADPAISKAAAAGAAVTRLRLTLEGGALIERVLKQEAESRGESLERIRADYARDGGRVVAALLGDGEKAKRVGAALSAFLQRPGRLTLRVASQKGVGLQDATLRKPGEILEEAEVEAVAE